MIEFDRKFPWFSSVQNFYKTTLLRITIKTFKFNLFYSKFYENLIFFLFIQQNSRFIAHNVPVVYDVFFLRPIKKLRSSFRAQKNVPEENRTKATGRLRLSVGQAHYCGRSVYKPVMRHLFCFIFYTFFYHIISNTIFIFIY
jgi:hypothetical protein